jgi:hypothetical protein
MYLGSTSPTSPHLTLPITCTPTYVFSSQLLIRISLKKKLLIRIGASIHLNPRSSPPQPKEPPQVILSNRRTTIDLFISGFQGEGPRRSTWRSCLECCGGTGSRRRAEAEHMVDKWLSRCDFYFLLQIHVSLPLFLIRLQSAYCSLAASPAVGRW